MATQNFDTVTPASGTLTEAEARDLLELVARAELQPLPRVEDVAETLHLEVKEVEDLLARVRSAPKTPPTTKPKSSLDPRLVYASWVIAAAALTFALFPRTKPIAAPPVLTPMPTFPAAVPKPVKDVVVFPMNLMPPEGYEVGVEGNGVRLTLAGRADIRPSSSKDAQRQLARCLSLLLQRAETLGMAEVFNGDPKNFQRVSPEFQVWVNGPGGANVSFPVGTELHSGPQSISTYKQRKINLDLVLEGLFHRPSTIVGPASGKRSFIFPPSGFQLAIKGRRSNMSNSGTLAVEPMNEAAVKDQLFRALRNMLENDHKPLEGRWRQDAEKERQLKTPASTEFTIETMEDRIAFTVPTGPGTPTSVQDKIFHEKADEAVEAWKRAGKAG